MNENEIQVWNYESSEIRTIQKDGEPWFVLADVCKVLELSNPSKVADRLEFDEKANFELGLRGGATNCINESGLYTVILRSDKPQAKPFRKWGSLQFRNCVPILQNSISVTSFLSV